MIPPHGSLFSVIMEQIIIGQQRQISENQIDLLLSDLTDEAQRTKILEDMNPHFPRYIFTMYLNPREKTLSVPLKGREKLLNIFNNDIFTYASGYKGGILILSGLKDNNQTNFNMKTDSIIEMAGDLINEYIVGISSRYESINYFPKTIHQAISVSGYYGPEADRILEHNVIKYENLGVSKLLISFKGHEELKEFKNEMD